MRKILPWLVTLIGCFLVTGALATVKYQQISAAIAFGASFPEPFEVVEAQRVNQKLHTPVRRLGGTVRRPEFVDISAEVGGRIIGLPYARLAPSLPRASRSSHFFQPTSWRNRKHSLQSAIW